MPRRYVLSGAIQVALVGVFIGALVLTGSPRTPPASAGTEVLPDLAMAPLGDFRIETVNGRRLLRFTAMMVNVGSGHFEVRGSREATGDQMRVDQVIFETTARDSPVARRLPTVAEAKWSGDGHDHWHVQEMMRYDLWGGRGTFRGAKVGFCFLDSDPWDLSLAGAGPFSYYRGSWCQNTPSALSYRMGISVGWGDEYEYYLAWQWVDVTDLPSGTYTIRAKVDPYGFFVEEDDENQCGFTRVSFTTSSNAVAVLGRGSECINDWEGASLASHIAWMFETGLTAGCAPDLYCTYNRVTRGQMAAFLARALDLPPTPNDYFADDDASTFEVSINRLTAAGISAGCGEARFCPDRRVTRGEMAAFLSRAYQLAPTPTDYFTDDDGSMFEVSINRLTAAGVAAGCSTTRFCPDRDVTRAEMAAFLHRAAPD